jgi:myo-inositol 2-dehydrogenase / D-chiro-inositol 1-dehydrogenase
MMARLGLAGVGRIGRMHAETLGRLIGVEELLVADAIPERAREVAGTLGATAVEDIAALFEAGIDGLVVAAPTDAHAGLVLRAAEAGLPVFCEKPLAAGIEQNVQVVRRIAELGGRVQIGFQRRFDVGYAAAREAVSSGRLGRVHTLRGLTADPAPPPAEYIKTSGGIFRDCSVHDFDAIRWVTGREIVEVQAIGSDRGAPFFREYGDVDSAAALLRLDDDALALVSATRYNGAGYDVRLEVHGSLGSLAAGLDERLPLPSAEPGVAWPGGDPYGSFMERFHDAYVAELAAFVRFAAGEIDTPCAVEDALEALYVAEACERSRSEHRPVELAEVRK